MSDQFIEGELQAFFKEENLFAQVDQLEGESFRAVARRRTIRTQIGAGFYFAKIHHGVGWKEILKNLVQGRLPVLGARNEWQALKKLAEVGVSTMSPALFCETGLNPAERCSAILTHSLDGTISLEDFNTGDVNLRRRLIARVAAMARDMHEAGINHRDFYLCHFLLDPSSVSTGKEPLLYLIDLHRAQIRDSVPERWLVKDLGGLLFSAFDKNLTRRDLLRFIRVYRGEDWRQSLVTERGFWRRVCLRARRLYLQDHEMLPADIASLLEC